MSMGIVDVLKDEINLYTEIVNLSKKKTDVIVDGDTKGLEEITKKEHYFIKQAIQLERNRDECLKELKLKYGDDTKESWTLSDVLVNASEDERQVLTDLGNQLIGLINEQAKLNDINARLINSNLEYINTLIARIGDSSTYKTDGTINKTNSNLSILDRKV